MSLLTRDEKIQELLPSSDSCAAGHEPSRYRPSRPHKTRPQLTWLISGLVITLLTFSWLLRSPLTRGIGFITRKHGGHHDATDSQVVRRYNLTVGARWLNLDGGFWRGVYVCNGEAPCPTLLAEEGDVVELNVHNDLFGQVSIHWSGMGHRKFGFWNDGTGGLNQYGLLQRGNFTSRYGTSGHWGLNWYADHTGVGIIDGAHGLAYIAPSPSRPRPYHFITASAAELGLIKQAERDAQHLLLWNYYRRDVNWRVLEMRSEGTNLNCYDSILVNAKGRRHCRHPDYHTLNGKKLDESGCAIEEGNEGVPCSPTDADYEIVETHGRPWIMLNVLNIGFEHAVQFSIDDHKLWVVANDNGFVRPQLVDVLYVTNGARYTVLVKLDREGADYAMRYVSTSTHQNLEGYSILRYPALRYPLHGAPMEIPSPRSGSPPCVRPDGSIRPACNTTTAASLAPYPPAPPPRANRTLHFRIAQQPSQYEEHVTECFLNQRPWQLYHAQMVPLLFTDDVSAVEPPVVGGLPWGTTVDVIVQNTVDEVMPLYKHGDPMFLLGSAANATWEWDTVESAIKVGVKGLDLKTPAAQLVHDVPPLGWAVLRWQIRVRGATMLHSNKFKYYAMGMSAPLLEGMDSSMQAEVPKGAKAMPHVEFEPKNDGVFG
ncbi:multicopper oxidase [Colletotrichum plurivorum]|uniref:Multicopper oxidase n=1 Tax=Colletotrichum plurivorum TaxID=2175906 RepID=A0A8H6KLP5_9PEZI|nr:multicopper oxidase [Colletotrichum plurivorum]